jgi:hypothetical protein
LLLVSTLMSVARLERQRHRADQKVIACRAAARLLEEWFSGATKFPTHESGGIAESQVLIWNTKILETRNVATLRVHTVRLTIGEDEPTVGSHPLCVVDVLVPSELGAR